jgi:transposase
MSHQPFNELWKTSIVHHWHQGVRSPTLMARKCNIPISTARYNMKKLESTGTLESKLTGGKKRIINANMSKSVGQMIRHNKQITTKEIANKINDKYSTKVSCSTVERHLKRNDYYQVLPHPKPLLTVKQKKYRLEWAIAHKDDDWTHTIFTDVSSVQLFRNTVKYWMKTPQTAIKRIPKCRQKLMAWGAISASGTIGLFVFKGIMDAKFYIDILKENLLPVAQQHFGRDWRLQQDNDPKHTARRTKLFLSTNVPSVVDWPSNSPDLNPIENIWAVVKRSVEKKSPRNLEELEEIFRDEWGKLNTNHVNKFVSSMKSRCEAVIAADGEHIKY